MTAARSRLRGAHQALTPVVDVAREPRWGRVEETYGEDPFLVSRLGIAAVRGFQGDATFRDKRHVIATLKHFVGHGQPESGMNCAPANVSLRVLRETFLYTFKEALREAGAISVMASYNEIDGVPSHANRWLLRDVLRKEWGFKGFVVSDYYAIWELGYRPDTHGHFRRQGQEGILRARGQGRRQYRAARSGLLPASGRTGPQGRAQGIAARRAGRAHAFLEIRNGPVRRSLRRSR
jgi:beta-glucosidase